ncbi:MAG: flagellar export chaperone FlgN [Mariprofundaceae bacterium]|nr:flagellar export chaperone FlgN [Mariprofundaceae bacterium]
MVEHPSAGKVLPDILQQMDACCRRLEEIVLQEQEAVQHFDTVILIELVDARHACHLDLQELEAECRKLVPDEISLEAYIDIHLQDDAANLQALRRKLRQRLASLQHASEDNCLLMRAAYDVTTGMLQSIGALEARTTYGPGGSL